MFFGSGEPSPREPRLSDSIGNDESAGSTEGSPSCSSYTTSRASTSCSSVYSNSTTMTDHQEYNALRLELDLRSERITELEGAYEDLKRTTDFKLGLLTQELDQHKRTAERLSSEAAATAAVSASLEAAEEAKRVVEEKVAELEAQREADSEAHTAALAAAEAEKADLVAQIARLEAEVQTHSTATRAVDADRLALQEQASTLTSTVAALEAEKAEMTRKFEASEEALKDTVTSLKKSLAEAASTQEERGALTARVSELESELAAAQEAHRTAVASAAEEKRGMEEKIAALEAACEAHSDVQLGTARALQVSEKDKRVLEATIDMQRRENNLLKTKLEKMELDRENAIAELELRVQKLASERPTTSRKDSPKSAYCSVCTVM